MIRNDNEIPMIIIINWDDNGRFCGKSSLFDLSLYFLWRSLKGSKIRLNQMYTFRNNNLSITFNTNVLFILSLNHIQLHKLNVAIDNFVIEPMFRFESFHHRIGNFLQIRYTLCLFYYVTLFII